MRTRFLATDYFAPSSSSAAGKALALEFFSFPSLPVPALPPDPHFLPFTSADELPAATVADDGLGPLPIASALSDFLAAVIPQALPVPTVPAADEVSEPPANSGFAFSSRAGLGWGWLGVAVACSVLFLVD